MAWRSGLRSNIYDRSRPVSEYIPVKSSNRSTIQNEPRPNSDELCIRTAQLQFERKLRKEAEERCKQLMLKVEHTQAILNLRNQELERERAGRKEAEHMCQSLQITIDKLEQYLRKKNMTVDLHFIPNSNVTNMSMSEITRLQGQLHLQEEKDEKFQNEAHYTGSPKYQTVVVESTSNTQNRTMARASPKFRNFQENGLEF
ncbi:uncharacterized protein LOC111115394 [Crassostrea virginica]